MGNDGRRWGIVLFICNFEFISIKTPPYEIEIIIKDAEEAVQVPFIFRLQL